MLDALGRRLCGLVQPLVLEESRDFSHADLPCVPIGFVA
jgi:hypothetical protein